MLNLQFDLFSLHLMFIIEMSNLKLSCKKGKISSQLVSCQVEICVCEFNSIYTCFISPSPGTRSSMIHFGEKSLAFNDFFNGVLQK